MPSFRNILIISDIEGSTGCLNYENSAFRGKGWGRACFEMTLDVRAVVSALASAGVEDIRVIDFHRTGYNLIPEGIEPRARLMSGYRRGPVPGIGHPGDAQAVIFLGLHAASGSGGFLPHTLTSRIARLTVNGKLLPEIALFAASLAPFHIRPVLFSGCPVACTQAADVIPGIRTFPIHKEKGSLLDEPTSWRKGLARMAVASLSSDDTDVFRPRGPFEAVVKMRDGETAARRLARRWGFERQEDEIFLREPDMAALYHQLIRLCYLTPSAERLLPAGLFLFNLRGRLGHLSVRRKYRGFFR